MKSFAEYMLDQLDIQLPTGFLCLLSEVLKTWKNMSISAALTLNYITYIPLLLITTYPPQAQNFMT